MSTTTVSAPVHPALVPHLQGTVPPTDMQRECLLVMTGKELANYANTEQAGSTRMVAPGPMVHAYAHAHDCLSPQFPEVAHYFLEYEETHRHLSAGGPPEKGYTLIGPQHFDLVTHMVLAVAGKDMGLSDADVALAQAQTSSLLNAGVKWAEKYAVSEVNQRALLWPCGKAAEAHKVNLALGIHDDRPLRILKAVVARLRVTADEDANGCVWLTLNNHIDPDDSGDGSGKADHDWQRASDWMGGGLGTWAFGLWLDCLPYTPGITPEFIAQVRKLYLHSIRCRRYAMSLAESHGAPLGGSVDDYDPTPAGDFFVHTLSDKVTPKWDGTMLCFAHPGSLTAKRHAPKHFGWLRPRVEAYYKRADRYVWRASKPGAMDLHSASAALVFAGEFGVREAA